MLFRTTVILTFLVALVVIIANEWIKMSMNSVRVSQRQVQTYVDTRYGLRTIAPDGVSPDDD